METWQATIKEVGNESILTPTWTGDNFEWIKDESIRKHEMRKYLREFWGLEKPDVEWYKLEKIS